MKKERIIALSLIVFVLSLLAVYRAASSPSMNDSQLQPATAKKSPEKITASPKDIKEKISIYVFVGWMWLSIFTLIYFLKQKIKEEDRIFSYKDSS